MGAAKVWDDQFDPSRWSFRDTLFANPKPSVAANTPVGAWLVSGTNMTTALVTYAAGGGMTFTTAGASGDKAFLEANSSTYSPLVGAFVSDNSPRFRAIIKTGSSVASVAICAGFKLTATDVLATDDDQAFFRYLSSENGGAWQFITSRAGTDTTTVAPASTPAGAAVAASTLYVLDVVVNSDRTCMGYVNGEPVSNAVLPALVTAKTFIPVVGCAATTSAAKSIAIYDVRLSKKI